MAHTDTHSTLVFFFKCAPGISASFFLLLFWQGFCTSLFRMMSMVMFFLPFAFTYFLVHSLQDLRQRPTTIKNILTKEKTQNHLTGGPPVPHSSARTLSQAAEFGLDARSGFSQTQFQINIHACGCVRMWDVSRTRKCKCANLRPHEFQKFAREEVRDPIA